MLNMETESAFSIEGIYDHNINFLIGSGASYGLFPTLALNIKDDSGTNQTIEMLAAQFDETKDSSPMYTLLFMHYYETCIKPVMSMDFELSNTEGLGEKEQEVIDNYKVFVETILNILQHRKKYDRRCNVFTTNYDACFAYTADLLLQNGNMDFTINDGARGFYKRYLHAKNFNSYVCQTGIFDRYHSDIPQINLVHVHGSAYWYKDGGNILVDYSKKHNDSRLIDTDLFDNISDFSGMLLDDSKTVSQLPEIDLPDENKNKFWTHYKKLPIVNPTKWKFHETVFEEHYYQMLRLLSYELEKPNSVFIVFGFSFADEHILNLVKRSLSNPKLQLFICCFNEIEKENMEKNFERYKNVEYLTVDGLLNFNAFNEQIFTTAPRTDIVSDSDEDQNDG